MNDKLEHYTSMGKTFVESLCGENSFEHAGWVSEPNLRAAAAKKKNGWKRLSDVKLSTAEMDVAWQEALSGKYNTNYSVNDQKRINIVRSVTKPYVYRYKGRTLGSDPDKAKLLAIRYQTALDHMRLDLFEGRRERIK